jgi:hypothetical protein
MNKMKNIGTGFIFISVFSLGAGGCLTHSNMSKQVTILHTDCEMKGISISNEREELNTTRNWTAECNGKTYQCNSHEDGDSACYDITE